MRGQHCHAACAGADGATLWFSLERGYGLATTGTTTTFTHPQNLSPPTDVSGFYQWSPNLADWYPSGGGPGGGPTVTMVPTTVGTTTTLTATASVELPHLFLRVAARRN